MPWIVYRKSPLDRPANPVYVRPFTSLRKALEARWPGFVEFDTPTLVSVDGVPALRRTWDAPIKRTSYVEVVGVPAGVETMFAISLIVTVASLLTTAYLIATTPRPAVPKGAVDLPPSAPVFTFAGQQNIKRLNQIIEKAYGKNRWWPAYLASPYVEYVNNKALMHVWLSLGFGSFEIEKVNVNDTSLAEIPGAVWQYRDEGFSVTADDPFDVVVYCKDISNVELRGTNEDDYAIIGPYVIAQESYVLSSQINLNISFPAGLYSVSGSTLGSATVTCAFQVQAVDSNNLPTGTVTTYSYSYTASSTTPQRFTETIEVTPGRYRISMYRTSLKNTTTSGQDRLVVESVIGLARSMKTYQVAALTVELLGSDAIGTSAASQINVVATTKLPVLELLPEDSTYVWSASKVATRNPIWAFLDVFKAVYGAQRPDYQFDLPEYAQLAADFGEATFDYFFNNKSTVWVAAQVIAATLKAQPYIAGSDIRLAFDSPTKMPVAMFNQDNSAGLSWEVSFKQDLEADCIDVAFVDPLSGLQDIVRFTPPGSTGVNPEKISADGITDRDKAFQYGAYYYYSRTLRRERVSFTTGRDGFVPLFGDLVSVGWDLPSWGGAGSIVSYTEATRLLVTSEKCDCDGTSAWISLRTLSGKPFGPVKVTQGATLFELILTAPLTQYFDFSGDTGMPVLFTFGTSDNFAKAVQVTKTIPSDTGFSVEGFVYDPNVFAYDGVTAPERGQDLLPVPVVPGAVPWIIVFEETGNFLRVQWGPAQGATEYVVSYAYDPAPATTDLMRRPWDFGFSTIVADSFGANVAYVPRSTGDLYVRVLPDTGYALYWRGRIAAYNSGNSQILALTLTNNCDTDYNGPLDPTNVASLTAQGAIGYTRTANWDVGTQALSVQVDSPPSEGVTVKLTAVRGLTVAISSAYLPQGGRFTFDKAKMTTDGITAVGTSGSHPTLTMSVEKPGATTVSFGVTIKPLTLGPIGSVELQYQSLVMPKLDGLTSVVPYGPYGGPVQRKGGMMSFACALTGVKGYSSVRWANGTVLPSLPGFSYLGSGSTKVTFPNCPYWKVDGPYTGSDPLYATLHVGTMVNGNHFPQDVAHPGLPNIYVLMSAFWNELGEVPNTPAIPGVIFRNRDLRAYINDDNVTCSFFLQANSPSAPNTYNDANADAYYSFIQANRDKLVFLAVEYSLPSGTEIGAVMAKPVDVLGRDADMAYGFAEIP